MPKDLFQNWAWINKIQSLLQVLHPPAAAATAVANPAQKRARKRPRKDRLTRYWTHSLLVLIWLGCRVVNVCRFKLVLVISWEECFPYTCLKAICTSGLESKIIEIFPLFLLHRSELIWSMGTLQKSPAWRNRRIAPLQLQFRRAKTSFQTSATMTRPTPMTLPWKWAWRVWSAGPPFLNWYAAWVSLFIHLSRCVLHCLRQMTVTMGNQLVECQECHNLYHQDCHKPQVTDKDVNDPRLVWYCARCTRQMKRMVGNHSVEVGSTSTGSGNESRRNSWCVFKPPLGPETPTETISCLCNVRACRERSPGEKARD